MRMTTIKDEKDPEGKLRRRHNRGVAMKEFYHEDMLASAWTGRWSWIRGDI